MANPMRDVAVHRLFKIGCVWPISRQDLAGLRARPRPHHRGRGEALADRSAGARGTLRHRQSAGLHRQEGRAGQLAVPGQGRARSQRRRDLHRRAAVALWRQRRTRRQCRAAESGAARAGRNVRCRHSAFPISARAARTTPRPRVPEGSRAYAGIGCHYMAQWMDRKTLGYTQMGGEGANWIGEAPFSKRDHVFQNLGDGTYNHSGYLAIRAAIASGVNITYKILFNDAVAMTGGQANDGGLTVAADRPPGRGRRRQARHRGHRRAVEIPQGYRMAARPDRPSPRRTRRHAARLRTVPGVSVLIYDQTCAAEKRRRRKRGTFPDPDKRVVINDLVCEGCGDCGVKSNCVSVQPLKTEWGRKRTIDQSSCNKDYSCVNGFCPSFVTVHGAKLKKGEGVAEPENWPALPEPSAAADQSSLQHHRHRHRRHRHRHHRRHRRHGRASGRQGRRRHRHGRPRAEGRRGLQPYPHRQYAGRNPRHPRRRAAAPISCSAATSSWPAPRRCWAR